MKRLKRRKVTAVKKATGKSTAADRGTGRTCGVCLKVVCWGIVPAVIAAFMLLDAFGVYVFNSERLLVLRAGAVILLLPFFSEIKLKDLSVKRDKNGDDT